MKKIPVFVLLLCWAAACPAQENRLKPSDSAVTQRLKTPGQTETPQKITNQLEKFFNTIQAGDAKLAFFGLFEGSKLEKEGEVVDKSVSITENTLQKCGRLESYDPMESRLYGTRLLSVSYITVHGDKFFRWAFIYQNPSGNDWSLIKFSVDNMRDFLPAYPIATNPPDNIQLKLEKFFLALESDRTDDGFNDLVKDSVLQNSTDQVSAFVAKTNEALKGYGKMKSYELFDNRQICRKLRLLTYISYLEHKPLRWQFVFTTAKDGKWSLQNVRVDDQLEEAIAGQ
ncbi:MAG: hypothetical protein PHD76_10400 [Methylacidiphilales bacterium]|nr:hypothetical protein [Candidatus Methylacidiphilales bacterium]